MKHWKTILLIISLAFNFGFLGAFIYRSMERQTPACQEREIRVIRRECPDSGRIELHAEVMDMNQEDKNHIHRTHTVFHPQFVCMRQDLAREKEKLGALLLAEPVDTAAVWEQLRRISQMQLQMEQEVVEVLISQGDMLDPPQRKVFIHRLIKRMQADPKAQNSLPANTKNRIYQQQNPKRRNP